MMSINRVKSLGNKRRGREDTINICELKNILKGNGKSVEQENE